MPRDEHKMAHSEPNKPFWKRKARALCCHTAFVLQNSSQSPWSMLAVLDFEKIFLFFIRSRTNVRRVVKNGKRFRNMTRISIGQVNTLLRFISDLSVE